MFSESNVQYLNEDIITGEMCCKVFEHMLCFKLGKNTWKNPHVLFDGHASYVTNNITKPYRVIILNYSEFVCEMFYLTLYPSPPIKNGQEHHKDYWEARDT